MLVFIRSSFRTSPPSVGSYTRAYVCVCVCVSVRASIGTLFKCHTKKSGKSDTKRCGGIKPQTGSSTRRVLLYFFPCGMPFCNILKYIVVVSILHIGSTPRSKRLFLLINCFIIIYFSSLLSYPNIYAYYNIVFNDYVYMNTCRGSFNKMH